MALSPRAIIGSAIEIGAYEFSPTGIESFNSENNLSVSQNLYTNTANFNISDKDFSGGTIKIYTIKGEQISMNEFKGNSCSWNYNSVSNGIYVAVIQSGNQIFSGRVVVTK